MHGVLASRWRPGTVFGIARAGMWRSADGGDHWTHVPLEPLNIRGRSTAATSARCRATRAICGAPPAPGLSAISASCCAAAMAATAGRRSMSARQCRTRCSRLPSTSASRASCPARPMAARYGPAATPARAGPAAAPAGRHADLLAGPRLNLGQIELCRGRAIRRCRSAKSCGYGPAWDGVLG